MGFKILVIVQGEWGERIVKNIKEHSTIEWDIRVLKLPKNLPQIIDEPEEIIPDKIPETDLILSLGEKPQTAQLIVMIAKKSNAKAVIYPVDNNAWLPPGAKNQVEKELSAIGILSVFPKPFCDLTETGNEYIDMFAKYFGRPILEIKCNDIINEIIVVRGSPCGSTHHMSKTSIGTKVQDAREKCALAVHHYPCLASMETDPELGDTIMHKSGFLVKSEIERAIVKCLNRNPWKTGQIIPTDKKAQL